MQRRSITQETFVVNVSVYVSVARSFRFRSRRPCHDIQRTPYARVSTSNGHKDPEMQLRELREYAGSRGWQVAGEYTDTAFPVPRNLARNSIV